MTSPDPAGFPPEELARRVGRGDPWAEDELARMFRPRVLATLCARLRDREAAREVCNDVLMAVLRALRAGRVQEEARLPGFVQGTARNLANNSLRARRARPAPEPLPPDLPQPPVPDAVEAGERRAALAAELSRLGPIDQRILALTVVDGLRPGDAASELGLSCDVVRARKSRALRRLMARSHLAAAR